MGAHLPGQSISGHRLAKLVKKALKLLGEGILNLFHSWLVDASTSKGCSEPGEGLKISKREPEVLHKGIPAIPAN